MITKDQAEKIGNAIIETAEAPNKQKAYETSHKISWFYRCEELNALDPSMQVEVLQQAKSIRQPIFITIFFVIILISLCVTAYVLIPEKNRWSLVGFAPIFGVMLPKWSETVRIRKEIRRIAKEKITNSIL
jgi:hypothetical protein